MSFGRKEHKKIQLVTAFFSLLLLKPYLKVIFWQDRKNSKSSKALVLHKPYSSFPALHMTIYTYENGIYIYIISIFMSFVINEKSTIYIYIFQEGIHCSP